MGSLGSGDRTRRLGVFLAAPDKRRKADSSRLPPFHELLLLWCLLPSITAVPERNKASKAEGESLDVVWSAKPYTPSPSDVCSSEVWLCLSEGTIWPFSDKSGK